MEPLIKEYLNTVFSHKDPDGYHSVWFDGRYVGFRVDNDTIQLAKLVPNHIGTMESPGSEFAYVDDNSRTHEQVDAMFRSLAMDWVHKKALKMLEEERYAQYHDAMREPEISFSLRDEVAELEARYDTRV